MINSPEVVKLLNQALALHQAGKLAEAEPMYRQILAANPDHGDALHLLGVLYHQAGYSAQGLELIQRAAQLTPTQAILSNLGEVLRAVGRAKEAVVYHKRAVAMNPDWVEGQANYALALMELQDYNEAERCLDRATKLMPKRPDLWVRLCRARDRAGDPHGAVAAGRKAIELQPNWGEAYSYLGLALSAAKKHEEAEQMARRAVELGPDRPEAHLNLGLVLKDAAKPREAEKCYLKAIELSPNFSYAHRNLAALLDELNEPERAIEAAKKSLELIPSDLEAWVNTSGLYRRIRDYKNAEVTALKALELQPGHPAAHGALGFALLHMGDYTRGFSEYEWRWRCDNFTTPTRDLPGSTWDGSDPTHRTILVHPEQGFGDTIQFARYIPMLAARGATVIIETWAPLKSLMATVKGGHRVVVAGVRPPPYDLHIALLSLPKIFETTLENIPQEVPYFFPDEQRLATWKKRIDDAGSGLKVGLVWAGNLKPDPLRTCPIANLAPLAKIPGITFISLQNRSNPQGSDPPPEGMNFVDVSEDLKDFAETAAAMTNLDLIITIDTAAAHLAGALGRPTWAMLPLASDWRWLDDREDSVWYPTMRLFRQQTSGDWTPVIQRVAMELEKFVAEHKPAVQ